jgi:hypothetical protein
MFGHAESHLSGSSVTCRPPTMVSISGGESDLLLPVDGEADEVRVLADEVGRSAPLPAEIDHVNGLRVGRERRGYDLQAERWPAAAANSGGVRVDAQDMSVSGWGGLADWGGICLIGGIPRHKPLLFSPPGRGATPTPKRRGTLIDAPLCHRNPRSSIGYDLPLQAQTAHGAADVLGLPRGQAAGRQESAPPTSGGRASPPARFFTIMMQALRAKTPCPGLEARSILETTYAGGRFYG